MAGCRLRLLGCTVHISVWQLGHEQLVVCMFIVMGGFVAVPDVLYC